MNEKAKHASVQRWGDGSRLVVAASIPLAAFAVQWIFWADIQPYAWFLFFPAVFFSSWVGGVRGGLLATTESTLLVWCFFIPPRFSFALERPIQLVSIAVFVGMGILFSFFNERLRKSNLLAAAAAKQAGDERYRELFENMNEGLAYCRMIFEAGQPVDFEYLEVNARFTERTGLTNVVGKRVSEVIPGLRTSDPEIFEIYGRVARTGKSEKFERFVNALQTWFAVSVISPQPGYFLTIFDVITERKRVEQQLKEATLYAETLVAASPIGIITYDATGQAKSANEAAARLIGTTLEKVRQQNFRELDSWKNSNFLELADQALTTGKLVVFESQAVSSYGKELSLACEFVPFQFEGKPHLLLMLQDIGARKKAEAALRASEQRLRLVTENAHVGLVVVNREHRYVYANAAYGKILNLPSTELTGLRVADVLKELYAEQVKPRLDRAFAGERVIYELRRPLNGADRYYAVTYEPDKTVTGKEAEVVVVVIFDITERKLAENSIAAAGRLAQSTIDALSAHICLLDETGKILTTNEAWRRFAQENHGANLLAATGGDNYLQVCDAVTGPETAEATAFAAGIRAVLAGTTAEFAMEYPCHSPTEQRWFIGRVTRFTGKGDVRVVVAHENITVRKQTEAAARRLAAIVEYSEDAIIGKNLEGIVTSWNAGAEKVFGYTADEMVGSPFNRLIPPDRQGEEEVILARIKRGESVEHFETVRQKKGGKLMDVSVTVSPIKDAAGKIIGASKVARDITARKQAEEALQKSEARLNFALQTSGIGAWDLNLIDHTASRTLIHEQIFGYTDKLPQWTYERFLEHVLPEDRAEVDRQFQEAVKTQSDWRFECRIRRVDGVVRWIFAAGGHQKDAQGKSVRLSGIVQDITERHNAEAKLRESEEKFARLFDSNPAATSVTTMKDGRYVNVNAAWLKKFQWSQEEVIGHTVHELGIWPDLAKREALFAKLKEQGWVYNYEIQLRTKTGQIKHIMWSGVLLFVNGEECLLGSAMDITKQREAMKALQESQLLYFTLVTQLPIGIFQKDEAGRYVYVNPAFCKIKGIEAEKFIGRTPKEVDAGEFIAPEADGTASKYAADGEDHHRQIIRTGKSFEVDEEYTLADGKRQFVHVMKLPVLGGGGKVVGSQGIMLDITERKLSDEQLWQSEERYKGLFERSLDCVFLSDFEGKFLDANPAALHLLGYESSDITKLTFASLLSPDQLPIALKSVAEIRSTGFQKMPTEFRLRAKDGREVFVETQSSLVYRDGKPFAIQGIARDITARRKAEESLARLGTAVEQSAESIVITDTKGIMLYANPAFEKTSGYTRAEALGKSTQLLKSGKQDKEFYRRLWSALERGDIWTGHFINRHKSGSFYEEEATISPVRDTTGKIVNYVAVKRDVTREMQLEAQFRQSQKMEAIGQLAGGVAHDFNNILAVIQLQAGMLKIEPNLTEAQMEYAYDIEKAAHRAADLTRQLLLFSRKQAMLLRDIDLNETITSIAKMLQRVLRENIQMQFKLAAHPLLIHADASMMDQVLMNLTVNARDAMPNGGELHIETSVAEFDQATVLQTPQARVGVFACVAVTDNGCGIAPETMPRIFEPFFTTKEVGKGTGLGLATVFGIVQQHQGWVNVISEVGRGTTFQIYLPLLPSPTHKAAEWSSHTPTNRSGAETILLVEDDSLVRASTRIALQRLGYRILEAADGAAALVIWKTKRDEIQLLLTDLVMPGDLNGKALAERLRLDAPKLKVIYVSGYSADIAGKDFQLEEGVNFLAKPFEVGKLAQIVEKCLG